jgi:hypothetical protein
LSGSDADTPQPGLLDRLQRAIEHAQEAARCYLALIAAEGRRLARGLMREAIWMFALLGFGLVGLAVMVLGLAAFIESRIGVAGSGQMIVGGVMVAVFLACMYVFQAREKQQ